MLPEETETGRARARARARGRSASRLYVQAELLKPTAVCFSSRPKPLIVEGYVPETKAHQDVATMDMARRYYIRKIAKALVAGTADPERLKVYRTVRGFTGGELYAVTIDDVVIGRTFVAAAETEDHTSATFHRQEVIAQIRTIDGHYTNITPRGGTINDITFGVLAAFATFGFKPHHLGSDLANIEALTNATVRLFLQHLMIAYAGAPKWIITSTEAEALCAAQLLELVMTLVETASFEDEADRPLRACAETIFVLI